MTQAQAPTATTPTLSSTLSEAFQLFTELAEDINSALENLPDSLRTSEASERRAEAAEALEGLSEPEPPETLASLSLTYRLPPLSAKATRQTRLTRAQTLLSLAYDQLEEHLENNLTPDTIPYDEAYEFLSELESVRDEAAGIEL